MSIDELETSYAGSAAAGFDRTPPQDIAAEMSVLGGMLLSKDAIADVIEQLRGPDFYRPAHEAVYEAIIDLYGRGEPADAITVVDELTKRGELARVGGAPYIHDLMAGVPTAANAGYYARIVRERSILRRLVEAGTRIVQLGYAAEGGDVDALVDNAQAEVYAVTERRAADDYQPLADIIGGTVDEIEAAGHRGVGMIGVPTGFTDLDTLTNGLHAGQMIVIAARPAIGKALAVDTPLPTPTGWTTMGQVAVGDLLLAADGTPTRVVGATAVLTNRPCYELEFDDGTRIVADAWHEWATVGRAAEGGSAAESVLTTERIAALLAAGGPAGALSVPACAPLDLPTIVDLPEDPQALGRRLASAGVLAERIPGAYLRGSFAQREALARALADGAGLVNADGQLRIETADAGVAADVRELALGLGFVTAPQSRDDVVVFDGVGAMLSDARVPDARVPAGVGSAPTRAARRLESGRPNARAIVAARPVADVPVRCVEVDHPAHLYLAGRSMVPTHNSTLGIDIVRAASIKHGLAAVVFSLEMSRNEIVTRILAAESRINMTKLRNGAIGEDGWQKLAATQGRIFDAPLFIDDSPNMSLMEIRAKCRRLKQRHDLKLVVIDYLQLMTSGKRVESRQQEVSEFSRALKLLAKELEVPVIAISQLNRGPEQRTDKKPQMADLRESGSIEQDADMVILLHREDAYEKESPRAGEADLIVAKHRNGPTDTITVAFQGHYSRFVDMQV